MIITSIDGAARGFLRPRFMRAIAASVPLLALIFAVVVNVAWMIGYALLVKDKWLLLGAVEIAVVDVMKGALAVTAVLAGVTIRGAILSMLHRRLIALAALLLFVGLILFLLFGTLYYAGFFIQSGSFLVWQIPTQAPSWLGLCVAVFFLLCIVILIEGLAGRGGN